MEKSTAFVSKMFTFHISRVKCCRLLNRNVYMYFAMYAIEMSISR